MERHASLSSASNLLHTSLYCHASPPVRRERTAWMEPRRSRGDTSTSNLSVCVWHRNVIAEASLLAMRWAPSTRCNSCMIKRGDREDVRRISKSARRKESRAANGAESRADNGAVASVSALEPRVGDLALTWPEDGPLGSRGAVSSRAPTPDVVEEPSRVRHRRWRTAHMSTLRDPDGECDDIPACGTSTAVSRETACSAAFGWV
mmetsp:Transcript_15770/g.43013  ORF Transcript_15770/g.43013 Transcript_15770/m.43013 type:complete len:205 (-) Transcript_15770:1537-2151(-)